MRCQRWSVVRPYRRHNLENSSQTPSRGEVWLQIFKNVQTLIRDFVRLGIRPQMLSTSTTVVVVDCCKQSATASSEPVVNSHQSLCLYPLM